MANDIHRFTLHSTYTGYGCAICGLPPELHPDDYQLINGKKVTLARQETVREST